MSLFKKIFKKVPNPIKKIPNPFKKVKSKIPVIKKIDKVKDKAKDEIKEAVDKALKEALDALKDIASPVVQDAFKIVLKRLIGLSHLAPKSVSFEGQVIVGLSFDFDLQAVLDHVRKWSGNPPKSKGDLKQFVIDLAPTHVKVFTSAGLSLGVEASVGVGFVWEKEYLINNWEKIVG